MTPRRGRRVALIVAAGIFATTALLLAWFWIASSGAVTEVRAMEDRAIGVVEDLRIPELEPRRGPSRIPEGDIRLAWALSKVGDPERLGMLMVDDLYWRPGRGVGVSMLFRSELDMPETCRRLAERVGRPLTKCPDSPEGPEWEEWWVPIRGGGVSGGARIFRHLRSSLGTTREYLILVEFEVHACGSVREPGSGPCP
jgi:hypothetical protein